MYESYRDLQEKPFESMPDPRSLFPDDRTADVFTRILYTIKAKRAAALPAGELGCGKTLLTRALLQELAPENTEITLLPKTVEGLLRKVLYQLSEDKATRDRAQIVHHIHEILFVHHLNGKEAVLAIEEGQHLEKDSVLEEIRIDPRGQRLDESSHIDLEKEPILYIIDPAIEEEVLESAPT